MRIKEIGRENKYVIWEQKGDIIIEVAEIKTITAYYFVSIVFQSSNGQIPKKLKINLPKITQVEIKNPISLIIIKKTEWDFQLEISPQSWYQIQIPVGINKFQGITILISHELFQNAEKVVILMRLE